MKYLPLDTAGPTKSGYQQQVREDNIKHIFDLVRSGRCKSRAELVRQLKLSATSVSVLVEELTKRDLIRETGPTLTATPGRRPISLGLNGDGRQLVAFTLNREGVHYALMNLNCQVLESDFFPFPSAGLTCADAGNRYAELFEDILDKRAKRFERDKALVVGINFPGVYLHDQQMVVNQTALGVNVAEASMRRLRDRLGLPVFLFNDTKSLAYAEKKRLDAANPEDPETLDMIFVEIHDRISCALISRGKIYTGPSDAAGEIGHITIDHQGPLCVCGNRGCLEHYVNQRAILEDARQAAEAAGIQPPKTFEELARRYPGEEPLKAAVMHSAELLAFGLYSVLCGSGLRRIDLGGGIEALGEPFRAELERKLRARNLLIRRLDLFYAQAGPHAESIGMAQYFLDKVFTITT